MKYLEFSVNTKAVNEIDRAKKLLIGQKLLVKAYVVDSQADLLVDGNVWISYGNRGDLSLATKRNPSIKHCIPKQGLIVGMDGLSVPASAKNPELAHAFINFLLEPEVVAGNTNELLHANPNKATLRYVSKTIAEDSSICPPAVAIQRSKFLYDVAEATPICQQALVEIRSA